MRVFVSEFVIGGASLDQPLPESMRREGLAMLSAVVEDLTRIPDCSVVTTLEPEFTLPPSIEAIRVTSSQQEAEVFHTLLHQADAALIIAPETGGHLAARCRHVAAADITSWNCTPAAIELCGDKLQMAAHLRSAGIATPDTRLVDFNRPPEFDRWPVVLKPRDGAGSWLTFRITTTEEFECAKQAYLTAGMSKNGLVQACIDGTPLSTGVIISLDGHSAECLPVCRQKISSDGRCRYLGSEVPAKIAEPIRQAVHELALTVCRSITGLAGYIGIDLVLTPENNVLVLEINPRLTTSYVGYRKLFVDPLPIKWLPSINNCGMSLKCSQFSRADFVLSSTGIEFSP